jgi:serine/threonine protein kinase
MYKYNKKSKKYNNNGGSVLGIGSYGCVIRPNIACKNYISDNKYVSKLVNINDIKSEYDIIDLLGLNKLNNFENHVSIPLEICNMKDNYSKNDIKNIYKSHKNDIIKCINQLPSLKMRDDNANIIQLYGGISFSRYREINNRQDIKYMIPYYDKLFQSIIFLNRNGIVHRDITHNNIVIDMDNNMVRLIDFGLSMFIDDTYNIKNIKTIVSFDYNTYKKGYYIWPIELYIFSNIYDITNSKLEYINEDVYNNYYNEYSKIWIPNKDKKMYSKKLLDDINKLNNYVKKKMVDINVNRDYTDIIKWKKEVNSKLDVFSLGVFLIKEIQLLEPYSENKRFINNLKHFIYNTMLVQNAKDRFDINFAYEMFMLECQNI